jgi:hypothetical protein
MVGTESRHLHRHCCRLRPAADPDKESGHDHRQFIQCRPAPRHGLVTRDRTVTGCKSNGISHTDPVIVFINTADGLFCWNRGSDINTFNDNTGTGRGSCIDFRYTLAFDRFRRIIHKKDRVGPGIILYSVVDITVRTV